MEISWNLNRCLLLILYFSYCISSTASRYTTSRDSLHHHMGVSTNTGGISPKMDGENFMENPINIDDLGGKNPYFWFNIHILKTTCPSSLNHHLALQAARTDPGNVPEGPEWRDFDRPPRLGDEFAVIVG